MNSSSRSRTRRLERISAALLCTLTLNGCGAYLPALNFSFCGDDNACGSDATEQASAPQIIEGPQADDKKPDLSASSATLDPDLISKLRAPLDRSPITREASSGPLTLKDVVRSALKNSPQIGLAAATRVESEAGIDGARAAYRPTFDFSGGTGQAVAGTFRDTSTKGYWDRTNTNGSWRNDVRLSSSMMLYDFGAADADFARALKTRDAASLREAAIAEDVAFSAAQLYVRIQQNRDLLVLADENLSALRAIADLITSNVQDGNATQADIKRVEARLLDAESTRSDQEYETKLSIERFVRMTGIQPAVLRPAPFLDSKVPGGPADALREALKKNPMIAANQAVVEAARAEAEALRSGQKPKVNLESSASTTGYTWGSAPKTELDLRGMVTFSYKLADGGVGNARSEQANARLLQAQLKDVDGREALELDLRQQYLQYASAKAKRAGLIEGVKASTNARELYKEQFRGGKRTLLELLEIQNAYYTARYNEIVNNNELLVANYGILRSTGQLSAVLLGK